MRNWRKLRSRGSRTETSSPNATTLSRLPPTIRMRGRGPGCATSARVSQPPCRRPGQSITRKCNAFGANKGFECHRGRSRSPQSMSTPVRLQPDGRALNDSRSPWTSSQVRPRPLGAAARIRTLLPPLGRPGHHGVPEPVFHDVPAAAASGTGSETGVARHRNTVEDPIRLRCD